MVPSPRQSDRAASDQASAARHPISRWYVVPAAERVARRLASSRVRPAHLTLAGLAAAGGAVAVLLLWPAAGAWAAALVAASWFFDRADGMLARRQGTASAWGAWLDANVDELVDVALHAAVASAASRLTGSPLPWLLLVAFLGGKYLFFHGLKDQDASAAGPGAPDAPGEASGFWRCCYHLPGNADVRVHLLLAALLTGYLTAELALVAVYYNARWIARYYLVARRLGGLP